jgi:hypothetical protein
MSAIRYVNPFSGHHHAVHDFKKLSVIKKLTTLFVTTIVSVLTLMLVTTPVFRALVGRFKPIDVKEPAKASDPKSKKTAGKINSNKKVKTILVTDKAKPKDSSQVTTYVPGDTGLSDRILKIVPQEPPKQTDLTQKKTADVVDSIIDLENFVTVPPSPASSKIDLPQVIPTIPEEIDPTTNDLQIVAVGSQNKIVGLTTTGEIELKNENFKITVNHQVVDIVANGVVTLKEYVHPQTNRFCCIMKIQGDILFPNNPHTKIPVDTVFLIDPQQIKSPESFQKVMLKGLTGNVENNLLKASPNQNQQLLQGTASPGILEELDAFIDQLQLEPLHSVPKDIDGNLESSVDLSSSILGIQGIPQSFDIDPEIQLFQETINSPIQTIDNAQVKKMQEAKHITQPAPDFKNPIHSIVLTQSLIEFGLKIIARNPDVEPKVRLCLSYRDEKFKGSYNLIGQFYQLIKGSKGKLPSDALLTINDEGVLCVEQDELDGSIPPSVNLFIQMLKETYGIDLANRIVNRYFKDDNAHLTLKELTLETVKKAFVGAAVNASIEDMKKLFKDIHDDFKGILPMRCGELLSQEMIQTIKQTNDFDKLSAEQLLILRSAFTLIPDQDGNYQSTLYSIRNDQNEQSALNFDHFQHDVELLHLFPETLNLQVDDIKLSLSEHIAKGLVYQELQQGMMIPLLNEESQTSMHYVHGHLEHKGDAVIAELITPVNGNNRYSTTTDASDVFLAFRGTSPNPSGKASGASLARDLDSTGVGKSAFKARELEIIEMVEAYLTSDGCADQITLNISGHSLAACDTQRALLLISKKVAESSDDSPWRKIRDIVVHTHNSPRLDNATAQEFVDVIKQIEEKVEKKELQLNIDITHVRIFDQKGEDMIQTLWYQLLGAHIKESSILNKRIVNMEFDDPDLGMLGRHGAIGCKKNSLSHTKSIIDDDTPDDLLQKELCQRYYWDDSEDKSAMQAAWQIVSWYASVPWHTAVAGAHTVIDYGVAGNCLKRIPRLFSKTRSSSNLIQKGYREGCL